MEYIRSEVNSLGSLNAELEKIETALDSKVSTEASGPRVMHADLDMNSNDILNLPAPSAPTSPVRLQDIPDLIEQAQGANYIGTTPPASAFKGMRWYDPSVPTTYVYDTTNDVGSWIEEPVQSAEGTLKNELIAGTAIIGGKDSLSVAKGGEAYSRLKTTIDFSLSDEDAEGLRSAMSNINKTNQTTYGRFKYINGTGSTTGVFDAANFGGQSSGTSAPIGFVFHHYTDGTEIQVDNVGEANKILVLKNAHNPTRRADKPADFVGTGSYISFDKHNYDLGYNQTLGFIDKDFKIVWTGVAGIGTLWQNRADDGTPAFRLQTTNAHTNILDILNGIGNQRSFTIRGDVGFTRTILRSETNQTNGVGFEAMDGDVWLLSNGDANKRIKINKSIQATSGNTTLTAVTNQAVETQVPFLLRGYNTASLPSASTFSGCMIRILDRANKPAYSDGTNWLFVATDIVVS